MTYLNRDYLIKHAIDVIKETYGDTVSVDAKKKDLLKFGRNPNVGSDATGYTIWYTGQDQPHETYPANSSNPIDSMSSSSALDTASTLVIEGHTDASGVKTFVVQTAVINGQSAVTFGTPLNRATRIYNSGSTNLIGEIYVYEGTSPLTSGKPTTTSTIHITVPAGRNQSQKASTSTSNTDYWIVTSFRCSLLEKVAAFADVALQVRRPNNVFREVDDISCSANHNGTYDFNPYFIVPKNSDVRLVAISDSTSRDVSGSIEGYLAIVQ